MSYGGMGPPPLDNGRLVRIHIVNHFPRQVGGGEGDGGHMQNRRGAARARGGGPALAWEWGALWLAHWAVALWLGALLPAWLMAAGRAWAGEAALGALPAAGRLWRSYYYSGHTAVAVRVATASGSTLTYLHPDQVGSPSLVTCGEAAGCGGAGLGAATARRGHLPFGGVRYQTGQLPTDRGYAGQTRDAATGLAHYQARYYLAELGRFIAADTWVPGPGGSQNFNRLAYARNNPLRYTDLTGHDLVIVHGAGTDALEWSGNTALQFVEVIARYKGWTLDQARAWALKWGAAKDLYRRTDRYGAVRQVELAAGIHIASYTSERGAPITAADVLWLHGQMSGFQDITLAGYSKGASLVMSYIAYQHQHGFESGPVVSKFILAKAPMGLVNASVGGQAPRAPFRLQATAPSLIGYTGGQVVNIYGAPDYLGTLGYLHGAALNVLDNNGLMCCGVLPASGLPRVGSGASIDFGNHQAPSEAAWRQAFIALEVAGDHGAAASFAP